jgi:hypothetical protein
MGEKLVAPLIVQGLADLILIADFGHWLALQALQHDLCFRVGIPCPSVHG